MLIKIVTRKASRAGFKQLVEYINKGAGTIAPLCINVAQSSDPDIIGRHFREHMRTYKPKRVKNAIIHTIISFDPRDTVTAEILEDIAMTYTHKVGLDRFMAYIGFHTDTDRNQHIHIMSSATGYKNPSLTFRLSKQELKALQHGMEHYQLKAYPQLKNSIAYTQDKNRNHRNHGFLVDKVHYNPSDAEIQLNKRGRQPKKEQIVEHMGLLAKTSISFEDFKAKLDQDTELTTYQYRDKLQGIVYENKKYRLKNLLQSKDLKQIFRILKHRGKVQEQQKDKQHDRTR